MEGTLNDFFNEIDKIAPKKKSPPPPVPVYPAWQKCHDNNTGYPYYWNVNTNEVTWEKPTDYVEDTAPSSKQLFPSASVTAPKIYKIQDDSKNDLPNSGSKLGDSVVEAKKIEPVERKVILLSSYNSDSDSDLETSQTKSSRVVKIAKDSSPISENVSTSSKSNSDVSSSANVASNTQNKCDVPSTTNSEETTKKDSVTGFSLLAAYDDSDEENGDASLTEETTPSVTSSILFPAPKPISVEQFKEPKPNDEPLSEQIDVKAFKRKRRIGVDLIIPSTSKIPKIDNESSERRGFGYKSGEDRDKEVTTSSEVESKAHYPGFTSGGVMFLKSNEAEKSTKRENSPGKEKEVDDIEDIRQTLNAKLTFLSEGCKPATPVQIMLIQMETLYTAMKAGSLTMSYLSKWLKETCSELINLEKDGAPAGWLLQWDRENRRYYYRDKQTGKCQWNYPQSVEDSPAPTTTLGRDDDDAMDICTTPPHPEEDDSDSKIETTSAFVPSPPSPPKITVPKPPRAPRITDQQNKKKRNGGCSKVNGKAKDDENSSSTTKIDDMSSVLDSFYSDLASLESQTTENSPKSTDESVKTAVKSTEMDASVTSSVVNIEPQKKKKKNKVKVVQGLAMKKKGVSKLVERWKSVQQEYD